MSYTGLISKMITFVALMLVGYVGARKKMLDKAFARSLSQLLMNLFLTCTVLNSVISDRPDLSSGELGHVLLMLSIMVLLSYIMAAIAARILPFRNENTPIFELLLGVSNITFIGLPVLQSLYDASAVLYCALTCIPFNVVLYTYGVWRLKSGKKLGGGMHLKDALTIPLIATFVALIIFAFDIKIPSVLADFIGSTSAATMPVSMIVIGATLGNVKLIDTFKEKRVYLLALMRLVVFPAIVWLIMSNLTANQTLLSTCVILAGCPSAVVITVFSLQYDYDAEFASKGILATTVMSMVTLPIWAMILG